MRGQAGGIQAGISSQQGAKRQVFQASLHNAGEYPQRADNGLEDKQNAGQGRKAHIRIAGTGADTLRRGACET